MVAPASAVELLEDARRAQAAAETEVLQAILGMVESVEGLSAKTGWVLA